jgi:signal peptidase
MDFRKTCKRVKNLFIRFWRSDNNKVSLVRDVFIAFLFVFIILFALWAYTGQWFGAPMVAIESGSMMHKNEPYGRIGTIDAGDMVLLVKVESKNDVTPFAISEEWNYGKVGDVIVYRPDGNENRDQIIHRAMVWVEVFYNESGKFYEINGRNYNASRVIYLPEFGIWNPRSDTPVELDWFTHSGFITKGDNPDSNPTCDQLGGISDQPIKVEWISGRASGELPWIGTINLFFNDVFGGKNTLGNVPGDSIQCLIILIAVLVSIPIGLDLYSYFKNKRKPKKTQPRNKDDTPPQTQERTVEQKVDDELFERFGK